MATIASLKDTKILTVRDTTLRADCLFYKVHTALGIRALATLGPVGKGSKSLASFVAGIGRQVLRQK